MEVILGYIVFMAVVSLIAWVVRAVHHAMKCPVCGGELWDDYGDNYCPVCDEIR